jgi:hypothetical protein
VSPRERDYHIPLGPSGDSIRVRIAREGKPVLDFTVQYEAYIDGEHRPVVRFDCHLGPHRDTLDWDGETIAKQRMAAGISYDQALNDAIADIEANWERYRSDFLRRRP